MKKVIFNQDKIAWPQGHKLNVHVAKVIHKQQRIRETEPKYFLAQICKTLIKIRII